jgi:hypothetical protein
VIFSVSVDLPEIVKVRVGQNIFDAEHRGHHGVILIVILVHAVAADEVQVRITILQFLTDRCDVPRVIVIINGICFFLTNDTAIDQVPLFGQADLNQLTLGQLDQVAIARIPKTVMLKAELFEAVADLIGIGHHLGRPGAEVLDATNLHAWVVNVDPIVIEHMSIFQNEHDGKKVAIHEAFGGAFGSLADCR